jgi:S1/P1 Nuclease
VFSATPALAWSDIGRRIICEVAFQELEPTARERVKAMIRRDPEFDTFAESCSWLDHPRRRAVEHYVNLARDADGFAQDACPVVEKCVVSAIDKDLAVLRSSNASEEERLEALKYLGHWVGDVHQPLHVSFEDDRGGNEVGISAGLCSWDLHAVWDSCIIKENLPSDPYTIARDLLDQVTDEGRATWRASEPIDWANESFAISVSPEVGYCVRTDSGCWYDAQNQRLDHGEPERTVVVDDAYIEANAPTVSDRLVKAGVRVGGLLNQALGTEQREALHLNR